MPKICFNTALIKSFLDWNRFIQIVVLINKFLCTIVDFYKTRFYIKMYIPKCKCRRSGDKCEKISH